MLSSSSAKTAKRRHLKYLIGKAATRVRMTASGTEMKMVVKMAVAGL